MEVIGTVFEVAVVEDRLHSVRVLSGMVEVRPNERETVVLENGGRWDAEALEPAKAASKIGANAFKIPPSKQHVTQTKTRKKKFGKHHQAPGRKRLKGMDNDTSPTVDVENIFNIGWRC